jgi:hypothetical protein
MYEEKLASSGLKRLPLVALTDLFVWKREASSAVMVTEKGVAGRDGGGIVFFNFAPCFSLGMPLPYFAKTSDMQN